MIILIEQTLPFITFSLISLMPSPNESDIEGKTKSISFRLTESTLKKLKAEADLENVTLNSFVNKLLNHSIEWDIPAAKAGWISLHKKILIELLEPLDDKIIAKIAQKAGHDVVKDILISMGSTFFPIDWITILRLRATASGFPYQEHDEGDFLVFITRHDMGKKWSVYFNSIYKAYFDELKCPIELISSENTVSFKLEKKYLTKNTNYKNFQKQEL